MCHFISKMRAFKIGNLAHGTDKQQFYRFTTALSIFFPLWLLLKCSHTIGDGVGNDEVHYGSIIASNIEDLCCCFVVIAVTQLGLLHVS